MSFFRFVVVAYLLASLVGCQSGVDAVVKRAIERHGGAKYDDFSGSFVFRDKLYRVQKHEGKFQYERETTDSTGTTIDRLSNNGFERLLNGKVVALPDSMKDKYSSSVNSVVYFFLLPAPLNDPSVVKELVGEEIIKGKLYDKVRVTFKPEGGGKDFQDKFIYWIGRDDSLIDYFAYSYEVNGGGTRFREAYNCQEQAGIRYCDYRNYGVENAAIPLDSLPRLFVAGKLKLASTIENKDVKIK